MSPRTPRELRLLATLTPHTRAHALQLLGECPLLTVSSGRRSPAHNRRVGGVPGSFHIKGRAVDFVGTHYDLVRASGIAWALRVGPTCTGPEEVLLERLDAPGQHLHVAW
jgi:uncharacterized protein YcbK (DUF882 family)